MLLATILTSSLPLSLSFSHCIKTNQEPQSRKESQDFMAIEAPHMNHFPPQMVINRDFLKNSDINAHLHNSGMNLNANLATPMPESLLPFYQNVVCDEKTSMRTDSGLTYNFPEPRKRQRNSIHSYSVPNQKINGLPEFVDRDMFLQMQQQQSDIDSFIAEHAEKLRLELLEQQKRQSRVLLSAMGGIMEKNLKEKEEEIQRLCKLNWALQDRVRNLCVENQILRDLAQSNEATANLLRTNLERVLAHASQDRRCDGGGTTEDAESCCGSSGSGEGEGGEDVKGNGNSNCRNRMCRKCGVEESCVLLLPCRHLCLCTVCGSTLHICPVCNASMTASVHVNMS